MVLFKCIEQRIRYCWWLRKNHQEIACCLIKEGRKSLKLTFFSGNWGLWLAIQGAPASCITFSANRRDILYVATLWGTKGLPEVRNNEREISMSHESVKSQIISQVRTSESSLRFCLLTPPFVSSAKGLVRLRAHWSSHKQHGSLFRCFVKFWHWW